MIPWNDKTVQERVETMLRHYKNQDDAYCNHDENLRKGLTHDVYKENPDLFYRYHENKNLILMLENILD